MLKKQKFELKEQSQSIKLKEAVEDSGPVEAGHADIPVRQEAGEAGQPASSEVASRPDAGDSDENTASPIEGKYASKLSSEELSSIATHPESVEADWMPAFTELAKRDVGERQSRKKRRARRFAVLGAAALILAAGAAATIHFLPPVQSSVSATSYDPHAPYLLRSAYMQNAELKQRAAIRLTQSIEEKGWTSARAAIYLGADEAALDALIKGRRSSFEMGELNRMLLALGASAVFPPHADSSELQQTVAFYTRVLALDPANTKALDSRATAYLDLKQSDLAIADLKRYAELKPNIPGPLNNLAIAYRDAGRYDEALQTLEQLKAKFPGEDIYQNRAIVYFVRGDYQKAIADSTRSIAMLDSPRPGPYFNRALAYEKLQRNKEAIADLKKVLEIDPTYDTAAKMIARLEGH